MHIYAHAHACMRMHMYAHAHVTLRMHTSTRMPAHAHMHMYACHLRCRRRSHAAVSCGGAASRHRPSLPAKLRSAMGPRAGGIHACVRVRVRACDRHACALHANVCMHACTYVHRHAFAMRASSALSKKPGSLCKHGQVHAGTCRYTRRCMQVHAGACRYMQVYACIYGYMRLYACTCACTCVHMRVHACAHACICVHACVPPRPCQKRPGS